jgi:hypothetical protein
MFTDMTNDEFKQIYLMKVAPKKSNAAELEASEPVGDVNWVTKGGV